MLTRKLEEILEKLEIDLEGTVIDKKELLKELRKLRKISNGESLGITLACPCCGKA